MDLATRSIEIIRAAQSFSGAYLASPRFTPYRYAWLRDGCFIADAMREAGETESCDRFLDWCARIVMRRPDGPFHARYTVDGDDDTSVWPHHQIDGWGLFLWASYPAQDISRAPVAVASISGERDGLSTPADIAASRANLPAGSTFTVIAGGVHAYFGDYGPQAGDGEPTVARSEAQQQIVAATSTLVARAG